MIIKSSERGGGWSLAKHLSNTRDNELVQVHQLRGFTSETDLYDALMEIEALVPYTACRKPFFHTMLSPPKGANFTPEQYQHAVGLIEEKYPALKNQARAMVFHVKDARHHAHVVWSRINAEHLNAINLSFSKLKMREVAQELARTYGLHLPKGLTQDFSKTRGDNTARDPLNYDHATAQQAKRLKHDPRDLKALVKDAYARSETVEAFAQTLAGHALYLAHGDKRGFVAVHHSGEVLSIARYADVKAKELKSRYGDPSRLQSVAAVKAQLPTLLKEREERAMKPPAQTPATLTLPETFDKVAEPPAKTLKEAWEKEQRHEQKRLAAEERRQKADALKAQRQHDHLWAWGNALKAATQSRHWDERIALERRQDGLANQEQQRLQQAYGTRIDQQTAQIDALKARQQQGGLLYRATGKARQDREALSALERSRADAQQRQAEAWEKFHKEQQPVLAALEKRQRRERLADEKRIVAQCKKGLTPEQERSAASHHSAPAQDHTRSVTPRQERQPESERRQHMAALREERRQRHAPAPGQQSRFGMDTSTFGSSRSGEASEHAPQTGEPERSISGTWERTAGRPHGGGRERSRSRGPPVFLIIVRASCGAGLASVRLPARAADKAFLMGKTLPNP